MNIFSKIIFFLIIIFTLNIILYYSSEDYKFFIKKLKKSNEVIYTKEDVNISDNIDENNLKSKKITLKESTVKENKSNTIQISRKKKTKKETILWKNYKDILYIFSKYNLSKLEIEWNLFDLTNEYPDNYYEYYSPNLTLYLFTTKSYEEVKDIMKVISYEVPYTIKEINNFEDKSFYINLKENINDNNIRVVISRKNIVFWLKIKKNSYNDIKEILKKDKINTKPILKTKE